MPAPKKKPTKLQQLVKRNQKYLKESVDINIMIDNFLEKKDREHRRDSSKFHPSAISKGIKCQKQQYYTLKGEEGDSSVDHFSAPMLAKMDIGTAIHNKFHETFWEMGILEGVWKCNACGWKFWAVSPKDKCPNCKAFLEKYASLEFKEIPLESDMVTGHADGILNINSSRFLLEMKSIKNIINKTEQYGFERLIDSPLRDHFLQTQLYLEEWAGKVRLSEHEELLMIRDDGTPYMVKNDDIITQAARIIGMIDQAIILYIAKNSAERKAFLIKRDKRAIAFLEKEMKEVWNAHLLNDPTKLTGQCNDLPEKERKKLKCRYKKICFPQDS